MIDAARPNDTRRAEIFAYRPFSYAHSSRRQSERVNSADSMGLKSNSEFGLTG